MFFYYCVFTEIPVLNANSVGPNQKPRSAASDLGLHCSQMPLLWDTRHKRVKQSNIYCLEVLIQVHWNDGSE